MCDCGPPNRRFVLGLIPGLAASLLLGACDGRGPEPVRWGEETCALCGHTINDRRFAAQLRGPGAQVWKFDDIGCAALYLPKQPWGDHPGAEVWVANSDTKDSDRVTWIDGRMARFVAGRPSPRGYDFGAVTNKPAESLDWIQFSQALAERVPPGGGT